VIKIRTKRRRDALDYKGGSCIVCDYNKCMSTLEFHHLDPNKKEFQISSKLHSRSWKNIVKELDKCVLVCSNCHREIHEGVTDIKEYI